MKDDMKKEKEKRGKKPLACEECNEETCLHCNGIYGKKKNNLIIQNKKK